MFYRIAYFVVWIVFSILFFFKRMGKEHIPKEGPAIIAANHVSYLDPIVIGLASPRPVCFMAKAELFRIPVLKQIITHLYAFPVHRHQYDKEALTTALNILKEGKVLGIFPEGTRQLSGNLGNPHLGVALLALKSGAPVIPAAITGTRRAFPGKPIRVHIGKPLFFKDEYEDRKEALGNFSREVMSAISQLMKEKG